MSDYSLHKASDLAGEERLLIERWLGRSLAFDETITVNAYRSHAAPAGGKCDVLRREIIAQATEISSRAEGATNEEGDDLLREAFDSIRGRRG